MSSFEWRVLTTATTRWLFSPVLREPAILKARHTPLDTQTSYLVRDVPSRPLHVSQHYLTSISLLATTLPAVDDTRNVNVYVPDGMCPTSTNNDRAPVARSSSNDN